MKDYVFKAVDPYSNGRPEFIFKNVPDDFKFCETYQYVNNVKRGYKVSFLIFFCAYDEDLFNQINALSKGREFHNQHTHAYKIKDYIVGNFWSVEVVSELPYETIEELNTRFLSIFGNYLIKIEQETAAYRYAEEDLCRLSIRPVEPDKWSDEQKRQWKETSERLRNTQQFFTLCIRRFLGFGNHTQQLEINTACIWFDEPDNVQPVHSFITRENDQWFMLMDDYNPSIKKRITIDDGKEMWDELRGRQLEIIELFNNNDVHVTIMQKDDVDDLVPTLGDMSKRFSLNQRVKVLVFES